jgi:tetratricopeptide (TPR) repeat protein
MTELQDQAASRVHRLLDAIELIQANRREEALPLLRSLISEDENHAEAWLWMSIAVDSVDKSIICLDNVLRINPDHVQAANALYRLRAADMIGERKRAQLRASRDTATAFLWLLIFGIMYAIVHTYLSTPVSQ